MTDGATVTVEGVGEVTIAALRGELDLSSSKDIEREILESTPRGDAGLVLDLRRVTFIDSSGLRMIAGLRRRLARRGRRFAVVLPRDERVRQVFALVDMADTVSLHESLGDAVAHCRQ